VRFLFLAYGRRAPCAAVLTSALLLTGCTDASPSSTTSTPPTQAPPTAAGGSDHDEVLPEPPPSPTWDPASREEATDAATAAMTAFARPRLDAQVWWAQLSPLLTPAAAAAYAATDPRNVPARSVTGSAELVDDSSAYLALVEVPTDAGDYVVLLAREGQDDPWLVERLLPPAQAGG
jgi:hypothetical protein